MMGQQEKIREHFQKALEAERSLRARMHSLREQMNGGGERAAIREALDEFRDRVADHFSFEEEGGYLDEAVGDHPRLRPRSKPLEHQHSELLGELDGLRRTAREAEEDAQWQSLLDAFDGFCRKFEGHEHEEERLLQDAFDVDIGAND